MAATERRELDELEARRAALRATRLRAGYGASEVDAFLDRTIPSLKALLTENEGLRTGVTPGNLWFDDWSTRLTPFDVQDARFPLVRFGRAYKMRPVDEFLDDVTEILTRLLAENELLRGTVRPPGP